MPANDRAKTPTYAESGVDEELEQTVFRRAMLPWLRQTAVRSPLVSEITGLASGYFATLLRLPPGPPLALTTDGVGTKILLASQRDDQDGYRCIGVDVIANNVNDIICVGATPIALLDYLATDRIDESILAQIAEGIYLGATEAGIAVPGGEIAQVGAMLAATDSGAPMLDLVGTALGAMPKGDGPDGWREPLDGSETRAGDLIIGLPSSGLHSNGYSLAREVVRRAALDLNAPVNSFGVAGTDDARPLGQALLEPTRIYVNAVESLFESGVRPHGLVHISGGGLLNLTRLAADVSYTLDSLHPDDQPPPLFGLLQAAGELPSNTMYETLNMGIGFCVTVAPADLERALTALAGDDGDPASAPRVIGTVTDQPGRMVTIPSASLTGAGDTFTVTS